MRGVGPEKQREREPAAAALWLKLVQLSLCAWGVGRPAPPPSPVDYFEYVGACFSIYLITQCFHLSFCQLFALVQLFDPLVQVLQSRFVLHVLLADSDDYDSIVLFSLKVMQTNARTHSGEGPGVESTPSQSSANGYAAMAENGKSRRFGCVCVSVGHPPQVFYSELFEPEIIGARNIQCTVVAQAHQLTTE